MEGRPIAEMPVAMMAIFPAFVTKNTVAALAVTTAGAETIVVVLVLAGGWGSNNSNKYVIMVKTKVFSSFFCQQSETYKYRFNHNSNSCVICIQFDVIDRTRRSYSAYQ